MKRLSPDEPEHRLSHWVDQALDRILLPPCRYTAQDTAGRAFGASWEEQASARMRWEQKRKWYGVKPYQLDWRVTQETESGSGVHRAAEIELKWGTDTSANQDETIRQCEAAGLITGVARTVTAFVNLLYDGGFRLHPNWANILTEVECRHAAAQDAAGAKPARKSASKSRARQAKPSLSQVRKTEALRSWILF